MTRIKGQLKYLRCVAIGIAAALLPAVGQSTSSPIVCPNGVVVYDGVCPPILPSDGFPAMDVAVTAPILVGELGAGVVFIIGSTRAGGGFDIQHWDGKNNKFLPYPGAAVRIASTPDDRPWVINDGGYIFQWLGTAWQQMPGAAVDIGIGANGAVWVITSTGPLYSWNPSNNSWVPGPTFKSGRAIAVDPQGNPWVAGTNGVVASANVQTGSWTSLARLPTGFAIDLAIGADGTVYVLGNDYAVWAWQSGAWAKLKQLSNGTSIGAGGSVVYVASPAGSTRIK